MNEKTIGIRKFHYLHKYIHIEIIRNIGFLGVGNLTYALSQWLIIILATKLGGVEATAQLALGLAIVTPLALFLGTNLKIFIATDIDQKYTFDNYFSLRIISNSCLFVCVLAVSAFFISDINIVETTILLGIIKVIEGFEEVCWGINQRKEVMDSIGLSRLFRSITCVASIGIFLWIFHDLRISLIIWALCWLGILLFYDLPNALKLEKLSIHISDKILKKIFISVLPLGLIAGLLSLIEKVPLYQISTMNNQKELGYFAALAFITQGVSLGISAVTETMTPKLANYYKYSIAKYTKTTLLISLLCLVIGIILFGIFYLFGDILLPILYTPDFLVYKNLLLILLIFGIVKFLIASFGVSITAAGYLKIQVPVFMISLMINVVVGFILVPIYGLNGVLLGMAAGYITNLFGVMIIWIYSISKPNLYISTV